MFLIFQSPNYRKLCSITTARVLPPFCIQIEGTTGLSTKCRPFSDFITVWQLADTPQERVDNSNLNSITEICMINTDESLKMRHYI